MQILIKSRQMPVTSQLRQQIERKVRRLSRLVDENTRVEVTVAEEKTRSASDRYSLQLALSGNVHPIHSEVSAVSATAALDLVIDKVVAQLGRQIQQADLVADNILVKITHGVTPWRSRAVSIKIRTSIKPGNPTLWQGRTVSSSRNYYRLAIRCICGIGR